MRPESTDFTTASFPTQAGVKSRRTGFCRADARAAVRLGAAGAERVLLARLQRSIAARQWLEAEIVTRAAVAEAVASLVADAYVEPDLRHAALAVPRLLRGERYAELLSDLADQAELEGTPLLAEVQAERRWSQGSVKQP